MERDSCTKQLNTCMTSKETYEVERDSCAEQLNTTTTEREKCKNKIAESIKREKDLDNRLIRLNTSLEVCKTRSEEYRNKRDECIRRENNCRAKIRNLEAEMEFLKSVAKVAINNIDAMMLMCVLDMIIVTEGECISHDHGFNHAATTKRLVLEESR